MKSLDLYEKLLPTTVDPEMKDALSRAIPFDCRDLPYTFVLDTGLATMEEMAATNDIVRLPYHYSYFEFASELCVIANEVTHHSGDRLEQGDDLGDDLGTTVETRTFVKATVPGDYFRSSFGEFANGVLIPGLEPSDFFEVFNTDRDEDDDVETLGATMVLGALTLLKEKFVIDYDTGQPAIPKLSRFWKHRRGNPPTMHHVTVNVPNIKRRATHGGGTHESPQLHWRRGHYRVYHRGSEFEKRGWARKCLVGDPSRGFCLNTSYRLVNSIIPFRQRPADDT